MDQFRGFSTSAPLARKNSRSEDQPTCDEGPPDVSGLCTSCAIQVALRRAVIDAEISGVAATRRKRMPHDQDVTKWSSGILLQ